MPEAPGESAVSRLRSILLAAPAPTGGWGYYAGKTSRIEATCWSLLALAETWPDRAGGWKEFSAPHLAWLAARQQPDGVLLDQSHSPPNLTANGFAACVLGHFASAGFDSGARSVRLPSLLDALIGVKGVAVRVPDSRQDTTLQAWPWIPDTFSWVEPTCWCVLALKKSSAAHPGIEARIKEADKLMLDRSCAAGGWNAGTATAFGQDLRPYVPTTALGLIALQDRRSDPIVSRSLAYIDRNRLAEPTAIAMAMVASCLRVYGLPSEDVEARLIADVDRAERVGNLQALAMMLYSISGARHQARALRV